LTTKIHALADIATCAVALSLTAGQVHANPRLLPLVDGYFGVQPGAEERREVRLVAGLFASVDARGAAPAQNQTHHSRTL
jgi:transposase